MHDLLAELRAYRVELGNHEQYGRTDRAKQVRSQLGGVETAIKDKIKQLEDQAKLNDAQGADVTAAELRVEARRYQEALDEHAAAGEDTAAAEAPGSEDASQSAPRERAVPAKSRGAKT